MVATVTTSEAVSGTGAAAAAEGHKVIDPIHQFEIERIIPIRFGDLDLSLTNSGLWALIAVGAVCLLMLTAPTRLIPTRLQSVAESLYELVFGMTEEVLGAQGRGYFPFVFTLFASPLFSPPMCLGSSPAPSPSPAISSSLWRWRSSCSSGPRS
jgi:F-type H+-transporting ATPase subunit a